MSFECFPFSYKMNKPPETLHKRKFMFLILWEICKLWAINMVKTDQVSRKKIRKSVGK